MIIIFHLTEHGTRGGTENPPKPAILLKEADMQVMDNDICRGIFRRFGIVGDNYDWERFVNRCHDR